MGPVNPLLPPTSSHRSRDSVPSSGGSDPVNPLPTCSRAVSSHPPRRKPMTRPCSFVPTPYQSPSGAALSQLFNVNYFCRSRCLI